MHLTMFYQQIHLVPVAHGYASHSGFDIEAAVPRLVDPTEHHGNHSQELIQADIEIASEVESEEVPQAQQIEAATTSILVKQIHGVF